MKYFVVLLTAFGLSANAEVKKDWTVLVFLNGHNNLDSYGTGDMNEMEKIGSNDKMNVVVQWASYRNSEKTKRVYIQQDNDTEKVTSPVIEELPRVDMGDYKSLVAFVAWAKEKYPAERYFVDVWNHGSGWDRKRNQDPFKGTSYDDFTNNHITTEQLGIASKEMAGIFGNKVDILGHDACLMSMIEVAEEVAPYVDVTVGSEELIPAAGWPYDKFLKRAQSEVKLTAERFAQIVVEEYVDSYSGGSQGNRESTLSAVKLSELATLNSALGQLVSDTKKLAVDGQKQVVTALRKGLGFGMHGYLDIKDSLKVLKTEQPTLLNAKTADQIEQALSKAVVALKASEKYKGAGGLSIWMPTYTSSAQEDRYKKLKFNQQTDWLGLVKLGM